MVVGDIVQSVECVVIGAGPGGYVAAIRAAQLGREVILVERDRLGGVCLNSGCIPSKALIEIASFRERFERFKNLGIFHGEIEIDTLAMHRFKTGIIDKLGDGIRGLLVRNGVEIVQGEASFSGRDRLTVVGEHLYAKYRFEKAIIATGSSPSELSVLPFDGKIVFDSSQMLGQVEIPSKLAVVGGGVVGIEMAMLYRKLGAEVTVFEVLDRLFPELESSLVEILLRSIAKKGIALKLGTMVTGITQDNDQAQLHFSDNRGSKESIPVDKVLVSVGRRPNTGSLQLGQIGVTLDDRGFIEVDKRMETMTKGVYAIGDVVKGPLLAHRASFMGKIAAAAIADGSGQFDNRAVPAVIFSDPEIATVGLSTLQAEQQGIRHRTGVFPFRALGRSLTLNESEGQILVVTDAENGQIVGVHIIGHHASDLIAEGALAVEAGLHYEDLSLTIHAHPTLAEGMFEAAEDVLHLAIHLFPAQEEKKTTSLRTPDIRKTS